MRYLQTIIIAFCLSIGSYAAWGAFNASPRPWDATFEGNPVLGDPVSQGDDHLRQVKLEARGRLEAEHDFGTTNAIGDDTGRHYLGSARPFFQDAEPAVLVEDDDDTDDALDDGRLWVDGDDGRTLYVHDTTGVSDDNSAPPEFQNVIALPANAIILWAEATGDEACVGGAVAGDCPCGFTADHTFDMIGIRGADVAGASVDFPDAPGTVMDSVDDPIYDDILDEDEMPAHTHTTETGRLAGGVLTLTNFDAANRDRDLTGATGADEEHYHPFQSVLFCKKN